MHRSFTTPQDFKSALKAHFNNNPSGSTSHVHNFTTPGDLPGDIYARAYGSEGPCGHSGLGLDWAREEILLAAQELQQSSFTGPRGFGGCGARPHADDDARVPEHAAHVPSQGNPSRTRGSSLCRRSPRTHRRTCWHSKMHSRQLQSKCRDRRLESSRRRLPRHPRSR